MRRWLVLFFLLAAWLRCLAAAGVEGYAERLAVWQAKLAAEPANAVVLLQLGDMCHDEGVNDNREAVKLAEKYLLRLLELQPTNAMARALYGSTLTMKGRDAFWFTTRLSHVKAGIREMDAAVKLAPDDPLVRFTRANNNYYMPKFLDRVEIVEADFEWLWGRVKAKPEGFDNILRQTVALQQGQLTRKKKKNEEAAAIWRQGIEFDPKSDLANEMRHELDKIAPKLDHAKD